MVFQYNPLQLTRNRALNFAPPAMPTPRARKDRTDAQAPESKTMREFHGRSEFDDLDKLRENQIVTVNEQTIGFDVRLDATDKLDEGDDLAEQFGIAPQIVDARVDGVPEGGAMARRRRARRCVTRQTQDFSFTRGDPTRP